MDYFLYLELFVTMSKLFRTPQQSMVIQNGKISFIGTNSQTDTFLTSNSLSGVGICKIIDLAGKTILPGNIR